MVLTGHDDFIVLEDAQYLYIIDNRIKIEKYNWDGIAYNELYFNFIIFNSTCSLVCRWYMQNEEVPAHLFEMETTELPMRQHSMGSLR